MNKNTFRCVFGDHEYSEKETKDKEGYFVHMCIHCNLHGYHYIRKDFINVYKVYIEYYPNGYRKESTYSNGKEYRYNKNGQLVYARYANGEEEWIEYYDNGNRKKAVNTNGCETRFNIYGRLIYQKFKNCSGDNTYAELWFYKGKWVSEEPLNLDPENEHKW